MEAFIIQKAKDICKRDFMTYPDYDESIEMYLADALTILIVEQLDNDDEVDISEIYDFISEKVDK